MPNSASADSDLLITRRFVETLIGEVLPFTLIFNEHLKIRQVLGLQPDYLKDPGVDLLNQGTEVLIDELATPLLAVLKQMKTNHLHYSLPEVPLLANMLRNRFVSMELIPLIGTVDTDELIAVLFFEYSAPSLQSTAETAADAGLTPIPAEAHRRILLLERELYTAQNEREVARKELQILEAERRQAEVLLEVSTKHCESLNIELRLMNDEYRKKVNELADLSRDISHINTTTLFLDSDLRIKRFSKGSELLFNLTQADIGRPFSQVQHQIKQTDINHLVEGVLYQNALIKRDIEDDSGHWYQLSIQKYEEEDEADSGVIIELLDINRLKTLQNELLEALIS